MPFPNIRWSLPAPRTGLFSIPPVLFLTLWVLVLPLLMIMVSGVRYQIPNSINVTLTDTAPSSPPTSIATGILTLQNQDPAYIATGNLGVHTNDEKINKDDERGKQVTAWALAPNIPLDWAGVRTFETTTRIAPRSTTTLSPRNPSHNDKIDSSISDSSSISKDPPTGSHVDDPKRSAGIFILIKAIIISWAILLVGMLSYMLARYAEEILAEDLGLEETDSDEDHERTALLGQDNV